MEKGQTVEQGQVAMDGLTPEQQEQVEKAPFNMKEFLVKNYQRMNSATTVLLNTTENVINKTEVASHNTVDMVTTTTTNVLGVATDVTSTVLNTGVQTAGVLVNATGTIAKEGVSLIAGISKEVLSIFR